MMQLKTSKSRAGFWVGRPIAAVMTMSNEATLNSRSSCMQRNCVLEISIFDRHLTIFCIALLAVMCDDAPVKLRHVLPRDAISD